MMRKKLGTRAAIGSLHLHFANRNATRTERPAIRLHFANDPEPIQAGAGHHLEQASVSLQHAAVELETVLGRLPGGEQADLHEAIGSIMETLRLIASTHARLEQPFAAD